MNALNLLKNIIISAVLLLVAACASVPSGAKTEKVKDLYVFTGENGMSGLLDKNEIASLLNYDKSEAPFSDFPDMPADDIDFWTSTIDLYASAVARLEPAVVRFDRATIKSHPYFGSAPQYVRCVRNN